MRVIYKYSLNFHTQHTAIRLPATSKVVGVGKDAAGDVCVWIDRPVDQPNAITEQFQIVGTEHEFESDCWHPIGVIMDMPYVWHVLRFERKSDE